MLTIPGSHVATSDEEAALLSDDVRRVAGIMERASGVDFVWFVDANGTIAGGEVIDTYRDLVAPVTLGDPGRADPPIATGTWRPLPVLA